MANLWRSFRRAHTYRIYSEFEIQEIEIAKTWNRVAVLFLSLSLSFRCIWNGNSQAKVWLFFFASNFKKQSKIRVFLTLPAAAAGTTGLQYTNKNKKRANIPYITRVARFRCVCYTCGVFLLLLLSFVNIFQIELVLDDKSNLSRARSSCGILASTQELCAIPYSLLQLESFRCVFSRVCSK